MVLADDNFASITAAVKEGRTVYDNLKKSIVFMLPTNGGEAMVIVVAIFLGLTLPITRGADPVGEHGDRRHAVAGDLVRAARSSA